jgi:arabinogalactan endo-1,4-beta-galactosidase
MPGADPNHNNAPTEWPTTLPTLASTLRNYVKSTLQSFHESGVSFALVSLGNEIRNGMLWPLGEADVNIEPYSARIANFTNLATLYKSARLGVDDAVASGAQKPQVMIHIDDGWNLTLQQTWFSSLMGTGIVNTGDWDVFAFSFYPFYGVNATYANLQESLDTLAMEYRKPLHVVETDWPVICNGSGAPELSEPSIPVSVQGQIEWVHGIANVVKNVPFGLGQGVNYWEPAWLNSTSLGSACEDNLLFWTDWSQWPKMLGYSRESVDMYLGI